jgi:hypothetical protein
MLVVMVNAGDMIVTATVMMVAVMIVMMGVVTFW